ncbi:MAG: MarR family transcriptional regulator [Myxococcota bacterium]
MVETALRATLDARSGAMRDDVWSRYRSNTARHLIGVARDFENRMLGRLEAKDGYPDLRPSFGPVLSLVAERPRPLRALADALSISPQAVSQLVSACERAGFTERRADPNDGRTRLIALTRRGRRLIADAGRQLRLLSSEYAERVGHDVMNRFEEAATRLLRARSGAPDVLPIASGAASIGALPLLSVDVQRTLMDDTTARGHDGLKMSHAQVLPLIGPEGARVAALARVQGISRQAISATARELERMGYLRREADPRDRRGVVFLLSEAGETLIRDSVSALDALDASYAAAIGTRRFAALQRGAEALYDALGLEREIFDGAPQEGEPLDRLARRLRRDLGPEAARRLAALLTEPRNPTAADAALGHV